MLVTQPNIIELSSFTGGWAPDGTDAAKDEAALIDVLNLIPDRADAMVTRKGFKRLLEELAATGSHYIRSLHPFRTSSTNYLIAVVSDGSASANNVRLYAITLSTLVAARIDTAGRTWLNPTSSHWGLGIDGVYYGGVKGEVMYSWDPAGSWDADASVKTSWKTVVDAVNDSVTVATQVGRDFAYNGKEVVTYSAKQYSPSKSIRYDSWDNDEKEYQVEDLVSRYATWASTSAYWKSFRCIKKHNPVTATNAPGTGTNWKDFWTKVRLPLPVVQSETSNGWHFVPVAAKTSIAAWHADRLFMRYDDQGDKSRLLYSAPIKIDKGQDIPDTSWDPTDFAPGSDIRGAGGGWIPFNDGKHPGPIQALHSYNNYLIVFKRQAVWVLIGTDDETWQTRRLQQGIGCVGPKAKVTHNGLCYFLTDDGLWVTDGTTCQEADGNELVSEYFRTRMDASLPSRPDQEPVMWSFGGFVWFSIPDTSASTKYVTIVYDPKNGSFWRTNLPVEDATVYRHEGVNKLAFGAPSTYGTGTRDLLYQYAHATASDADDSGADAYAATAIAWNVRFAWWPFGTLREQRRVRRVWAVVKGALTYTLTARRDWSDTAVATTARTVSASTPTHIEGAVFADSHAVNFELSSTAAPATVLGIAVDSQPRHVRYHS